jgi:hypothetical protein
VRGGEDCAPSYYNLVLCVLAIKLGTARSPQTEPNTTRYYVLFGTC